MSQHEAAGSRPMRETNSGSPSRRPLHKRTSSISLEGTKPTRSNSNLSLCNPSPSVSPTSEYTTPPRIIDLDAVTEASRDFQRKLQQTGTPSSPPYQALSFDSPIGIESSLSYFGYNSGYKLMSRNSRIPRESLDSFSLDERYEDEDTEKIGLKEFLRRNSGLGPDEFSLPMVQPIHEAKVQQRAKPKTKNRNFFWKKKS